MSTPENLSEHTPDTQGTSNEKGQSPDGGDSGLSSVDLIGAFAQTNNTSGAIDAPYGLRADGSPRRKPGRPRKTAAPVVSRGAAQEVAPAVSRPKVRSKAEVKAHQVSSAEISRALFAMYCTTMAKLIGDEWMPHSQDEADGMRASIAAYVESKGEGRLSPEVMLAINLGVYSAARLEHENTRNKLGAFFGKMWGWAKTAYKAFKG